MSISKLRSLQTYRNKRKSRAASSQRGFEKLHRNFEKFSQENYNKGCEDLIDEMKLASVEDSCDIIQEWVNWLDIKPVSIRTYFSDLYLYLYYRGIRLTSQDIKLNIDFPKNIQEELHPLSLEEYRAILEVAGFRNKAKYLCMGSSGLRPIEVNNIRKKDLELDKKRIIVHVPARFTKLKRSKTTFFSKEAEKLLRPILKQLNDDDKIFGITTEGNANTIARYRIKAGIDEKYDNTTRRKINAMSFRAWFITKFSRHDPNLAKLLAGQKGYLLQYDRMEVDELLEKYIEYEGDLLVYDTARSESKIHELEEMNKDKQKLEDKVARQDQAIGKILSDLEDLKKKS